MRCKSSKPARVIVVGIAAVGSYAVEALARSGVGHLVLSTLNGGGEQPQTASCRPSARRWAG